MKCWRSDGAVPKPALSATASIDASVVKNRDGSRGAKPRRPVLADDVVRFAGEALAIVLAETREAGLDAVELIEAAGVDPSARGEALEVADFAAIAAAAHGSAH